MAYLFPLFYIMILLPNMCRPTFEIIKFLKYGNDSRIFFNFLLPSEILEKRNFSIILRVASYFDILA